MGSTSEIYIRLRDQNYGPFGLDEAQSQVRSGRIPFSSWIFTDGEWTLLAELPELRSKHPEFQAKPSQVPTKKESTKEIAAPVSQGAQFPTGATISAEPVWFVIREKKKFGPYSAAELVSQLQRKQLEATAFVWRPGFTNWQKMSQVSEFSKDTMRRLVQDANPVDIVVKRKFMRAPYEVEVIAHDNTRAIEGKSMVIGEGGLFLATPKPSHHVGSRLKLHFREGGTAAFNAVAEVVSVVRGEMPGYCLRFVALSDSDRRRISKLVSERRT